MNNYWSKYVQTSEELYFSRALRFNDGNFDSLNKVMGLTDGMKILETGCAGGQLCHLIKKNLPSCDVTGVDLDSGHIEFAKNKTKELSIDCKFLEADALSLPFEENSFDACYSHTVINFCDAEKFIAEHKRVLKKGGRLIVMNVHNMPVGNEAWVPDVPSEEKELFDRLWSKASENPLSEIKRYGGGVPCYAGVMEKQGFENISIDVFSTVKYCPDFANVTEKVAVMQINDDRLSELSSVVKARALAPNVLTEEEFSQLVQLINERFDEKIERYRQGKKSYEYRVSAVYVLSGVKSL